MCSRYSSRMYKCLQFQARLTTCDLLPHSRMQSYHLDSCSWSSTSDQVCLLSAVTWKLSDENLCSFATPLEHGPMWCRQTWSVARVYNCPCGQSWNYKFHSHTYCGYSHNNVIRRRYTGGLLPPGSKVDAGHSLAAVDVFSIRFGQCTPPFTHSAGANM
jgi:hypothetical protein